MFYETKVESLDHSGQSLTNDLVIEVPTKIHFLDGSVALYDDGFEVKGEQILGVGEHWDLTRTTRTTIKSVPFDSIAFLEYYDRKNRRVLSAMGTVAGTGVSLLALKAIFGSCPTIYSHNEEGRLLEAELFSHSISSRYETDDLDRLDISHKSDGTLSFDVINEALETHYINKINLLAVDHPPGYEAFPTSEQNILMVGSTEQLLEATSKSGVDVLGLIESRDSQFYQSGSKILQEFTEQVSDDWIDLAVKTPAGARNVYVAIKARNTLFATVFLYDIAIAGQGFEALDWLGSDIASPWYAWRFADWFQESFSIKVQIQRGNSYVPVDRIAPTGPITWHQAAAGFRIPSEEITRLRLSFMPDNWVIDWIGVSFDSTDAIQQTTFKPSDIVTHHSNNQYQTIDQLSDKDSSYFITYPGDFHELSFNIDTVPQDKERTYFLASHGYYIEWLRMTWMDENGNYGPGQELELNDTLLQRTARLWLEKKEQMEEHFYNSKIPIER